MNAPPSFQPDELSTAEHAALDAAQDDDGAEHGAYLRGVEVGHARGLQEGRGAVVALIESFIAQEPRAAHPLVLGALRELVNQIQLAGPTDPAGYERGRADAIGDAARYLRSTGNHTIAHLAAELMETHERDLQGARAATKGSEGR